jgi:hypothetical protein
MEPEDRQFGEPDKDVISDSRSCCAHNGDPLGEETASNEAENLFRWLIEPMGVVDDDGKWSLLRNLRKERQGCESNEKSVGSCSGNQTEDGRESVALRTRYAFQLVEHREADLMKAAVREFQLGFKTNGPCNPPAV